jgi:hypothetical protein
MKRNLWADPLRRHSREEGQETDGVRTAVKDCPSPIGRGTSGKSIASVKAGNVLHEVDVDHHLHSPGQDLQRAETRS